MTPRGTLATVWYAAMVATLLVAGLGGTFGVARADVPTAGDIAACNQEARALRREPLIMRPNEAVHREVDPPKRGIGRGVQRFPPSSV